MTTTPRSDLITFLTEIQNEYPLAPALECTRCRRVADFLLSWWNSGTCGAFDLTTLWGVDSEIAADMVTVFALIARISSYPDSLGYESDFKSIVGAWRPELVD